MSFELRFEPWRPFFARKNSDTIQRWLHALADASEKSFKNMKGYPPASTPAEYPAIRTGNLRASIKTQVTADSMTIGSNMRYSIYLREGTSMMARRKMSDDALREGIAKTRGKLHHWVEWVRG